MVANIVSIASGALLGSLITVSVMHWQAPTGQVRGAAPLYLNTVMQNGACDIIPETGQQAGPVTNLKPEFPHIIATAENPNYGLHVTVLGRDGRLYHKHQYTPGEKGNWSGWKCLTPNFKDVPCSMKPHCNGYDNNPAMAMQPTNGTLIMFARQMDDLVPHEFHLNDPKDPDSWTAARGPSCLCNFPPCPEHKQTQCGVVSRCDNLGVNCDDPAHARTSNSYYFVGPIFPTSELVLRNDPENKKLNLYWRGFDGGLYKTTQTTAGDADGKWTDVGGGMLNFGGFNSTIE